MTLSVRSVGEERARLSVAVTRTVVSPVTAPSGVPPSTMAVWSPASPPGGGSVSTDSVTVAVSLSVMVTDPAVTVRGLLAASFLAALAPKTMVSSSSSMSSSRGSMSIVV